MAGDIINIKKADKLQQLERLFASWDEGSGTLTYGQVFHVAKPFMEGDFLNELGLIIQIASDNDGAVTQAEFSEFLEALLIARGLGKDSGGKAVSLQETTESADSKRQKVRFVFGNQLLVKLKEFRVKVVKQVKKEVRELMDSVSMISQDFSYSAALLRSPRCREDREASALQSDRFSKIETAWLLRTLKDSLLFLPIAAIIIAPLTPAMS